MKRRIKVWGKMQLYETSAVGLPAYPDAHASMDSFSLIKTLSNASLHHTGFVEEGENIKEAGIPQLNLEEKEAMEENQVTPVVAEKAETNVEVKSVTPEVKSDLSEIVKAIKEGLKDGLKELETERGLVEKQAPVKAKSIGEMAIEQGLFVIR